MTCSVSIPCDVVGSASDPPGNEQEDRNADRGDPTAQFPQVDPKPYPGSTRPTPAAERKETHEGRDLVPTERAATRVAVRPSSE
jgi:hypothetical protein